MEKDRLSRKLAVILHADVVDSTALVRMDETLAHQRIQDTFQRFSKTIKRHEGVAHEIRGDALVAEFARASDGVAASIEFQTANAINVQKWPDQIRPLLRVGIAMGEVIIANNTMTGEGVVLAQRLEQSAESGGVCIQGAAYETVPKRLPYQYQSLGDLELKGFDEPVRAYTVAAKPDTQEPRQETDFESELVPPEFPAKPSIAVLPFTNMSGDPEQEYFSDGVAEDITTGLSHFRELMVIARNSSFIFKGQAVDVAEIAKQLGVRYVLEGSVRSSGNRVRITAQLVEAETREHVWAQRYDRELDDIFEVQDDITKLIVGVVAGRVDATEAQRAALKPSQDMTSYDYFLRGLHAFNPTGKASGPPSSLSREMFQKAIDTDPRFARAHAYLAFLHYCDAWFLSADRSVINKALATVKQAIALDPADSFAKAVHGLILMLLGKTAEGISRVSNALEHNPNDAEILHYFGTTLSLAGRAEEGLAYVREAIRLNPFNQDWDHALALALAVNGEYEAASEMLKRYEDSDYGWTMAFTAANYAQLEQFDDARRMVLRSARVVEKSFKGEEGSIPEDPLDLIIEGYRRIVPYEGIPDWIGYVVEGFEKIRQA
jgi:adenylate cyclase